MRRPERPLGLKLLQRGFKFLRRLIPGDRLPL
jgi:hypothetical protein